jgi:hypothetical protein
VYPWPAGVFKDLIFNQALFLKLPLGAKSPIVTIHSHKLRQTVSLAMDNSGTYGKGKEGSYSVRATGLDHT